MKTDNTPLNLFVVLMFVLINPLYALSICAILNYRNYRINFSVFSVMFASSFGLFFFMREWSSGGDTGHYLMTFIAADSHSFTDIFYFFVQDPKGNEPLWRICLWLSRIIIGDHVDVFVFANLFIMFLLTAYLGKVVDEKRFVIVIACILFVSSGFFSNAFQVWRHTFALLLFFIGIFLLEAGRHRRLARGLMYSSILFHMVCIPIVGGYELLTLLKKINTRTQITTRFQNIRRYSIPIIVYVIFSFVAIKFTERIYTADFLSELNVYAVYTRNIELEKSGYAFLFSPLTVALLYYFWFNRKQISTNDVFIGINYFLVIGVFIVTNLPSTPLGRVFYFFVVGASILSAKLVLKEKQLGFLFLLTIILFFFYSYIKHGGGNLSCLLGGDFLNPIYGLAGMLLNYSEFLVLPSAVL